MPDADGGPDDGPEMVQINLRLSEAFLEDIDATWQEQGFNSRSEFLRYTARDAVNHPAFSREGWKQIATSEHQLRRGPEAFPSREEIRELVAQTEPAEETDLTRTPLTDDEQATSMSDVTDGDDSLDFERGGQNRLSPFRDRMRSLAAERDGDDLKELRRSASGGTSLSDVVVEDRNDRV